MTEEIIINEKSLQAVLKQYDELEQENKDFEILVKSLYKRIEELEKENEALAFRERLYKADYEASEQENKQLKSALEEINITVKQLLKGVSSNCINNTPYLTALSLIENKINEVKND